MISISEMKRKAANLDLTNPLVVTQNGVPSMVIISYVDYVKEKDLLNTLTVLVKSMQDDDNISSKKFKEILNERKEKLC